MATKETKTLVELLAEVQAELKAPKGQRNSFGKYNYRSAEDIVEAVKPLLNKRGLILNISDELVQVGDRYYIKATSTVYNKERDSIEAVGYAREALTQSAMSDGQVTGATSSYARKYSLNGLFAIDDTKDLDSDEYQGNTKKSDSDKTPKTPVKPSDKPWLNESDEAYTKAVEALKSKKVTISQILAKYKLSTAVRAKLESIK